MNLKDKNIKLYQFATSSYTSKFIPISSISETKANTSYTRNSFHSMNMPMKKYNSKKKRFFSITYLKISSINTASLHTDDNANYQNFLNLSFDKGRIKTLVSWFLKTYGQKKTIQLVENLKNIGFEYATKAGISLGIEDLKISPNKAVLIAEAEKQTYEVITQYKRAQITGVERFQRLIDTWHRTSENLKQEVINYFEMTDLLNPVYMMAFSGARGNISQVRQLVGMRGLMADPKGQILDFPIRSNFREGLTLTEYLISSYGARKGIVDTALRTANAGYLTRRLVDVAQHVIVSHYDCGTNKGILISDMKEGTKVIYSLQNRLIGRVLAQDIYSSTIKIASRNQEISSELASKIAKVSSKVLIRSALTCETRKLICQLCYGWSLGQGKLVSIGDAVGVIAAQSIGEPGTQLTMRTFHTGGVFSSDVNDQILGPYDGLIYYSSFIPGTLVRTPQGKIAFLTKAEGSFVIKSPKQNSIDIAEQKTKLFKIPPYTLLFCRHNERVDFKQVVAQLCSSSTQNKQRDDAEQSIQTELQGQVYMDNLTLIEQTNDYGDSNQQSWNWGYIWILSGKIYEIPVDSYVFPKFGDFVTKNSILNEIQWITPEKIQLQINVNNSFSEIFTKKLPNKEHHKLLNNLKLNKTNSNFLSQFFVNPSFKQPEKLYDSSLKKQSFKINYSTTDNLETTFIVKNDFQASLTENLSRKNQLSNFEITNKSKLKNLLSNKGLQSNIDFFKSSWLTKRNFARATGLIFKKTLLLFDTDKVSYKKIGYFFKLNLPSLFVENHNKIEQDYSFILSNQEKNTSLRIHQLNSLNNYYTSLILSQTDRFFIPVHLQSSNQLFTTNIYNRATSKMSLTTEIKLENSFDWKIFPNIILTWFPSIYETKHSSFITYEIPEFSSLNLEESEYFLLKQKNSHFYSKLKQKFLQFPLKNLSYNQISYNNSNFSIDSELSPYKTKTSKNVWFFQKKPANQAFKIKLMKLNFDSNRNSHFLPFKRYSELRWKNSNMFSTKDFFYRGRIFTIPHQVDKFIGLELQKPTISLIQQKQFSSTSLNWKNTNSYLYSNLTRQGKQVHTFTNFEGFLQIYNQTIFPLKKPSHFTDKINNFIASIKPVSAVPAEKVNLDVLSFVKKEKNLVQKDSAFLRREKTSFSRLNSKKIFHSLKQYNQNYYIALKFKMLKMNLNNSDFKKLILFMNKKNYKKLFFLKASYLNKNMGHYNYEVKKSRLFIENNLCISKFLKLKNAKNSESITSMFKFAFFNLNPDLEKRLIFNKIKSNVCTRGLQMQSGWLYLPITLRTHFFKYNKSIIPAGKVFVDDLVFGSQLVYLEIIVIKAVVLNYNLNFLNIFKLINFSTNSFSKNSNIYNLMRDRHINRCNSDSSSDLTGVKKYKAHKGLSYNVSCEQLQWVINDHLRNNSSVFQKFNNVNTNSKIKVSLFNSTFLTSTDLNYYTSPKLNLNSQLEKQSNYNCLLVIKPVNEYNIQEMSYYKNSLYKVQVTNFTKGFSCLLKQHYHTGNLNKQVKNHELISKFPNVDFRLQSVLKFSSLIKNDEYVSPSHTKKLIKSTNLNSLPRLYTKKVLFFNKSSSLLYFKFHLINNSTFEINSKKPCFNFNYLNSPNFSPTFFFYFNLMYTEILKYSLANFSNSRLASTSVSLLNEISISSRFASQLFNIILLFTSNVSNLFSIPLFDFSVSQTPSYFLDKRFFVKPYLNKLFATSHVENVGLSTISQTFSNPMLIPFPTVKNSYSFKLSNAFLQSEPFAYSSFLSPYEGELLVKTKKNWNTTFQKNRLIILTKNDLVSFSFDTLNLVTMETLNSSIHRDLFVQSANKLYKIDNLEVREPQLKNVFLVGQFIYYGDQLNTDLAIPEAGQVVHLSTKKLTIRKGQSIFVSSKAILHAYNGDLIDKNFPVVTLPYQKLKAGDIVQGIPKIEQFFEARITRRGRLFRDSIPNLLKGLFKRYKLKYPLVKAVRQSFYKIQQILIDGVQRVYRSQGVTIADKHIEIIVKQMTCKVKIINGGQTGFFPGELVDLEFVEQINKVLMNKVYYEPVVLGITKASLEVESFLSAASFQQTTRMLSKAAIARKKDFLKGLKENVIVGNLIPSGTGYLIYLQDSYKNFKI